MKNDGENIFKTRNKSMKDKGNIGSQVGIIVTYCNKKCVIFYKL